MFNYLKPFLSGLLLLLTTASTGADRFLTEPRTQTSGTLLVFSKTEGYRHNSIEKGAEALTALAKNKGWKVDHTEDAAAFNGSNLQQYDAVVFLNTTGDVLNEEQQKAFERFINQGGGFVGIHSAADTEHEWGWYGKLVGAYFVSHPQVQPATLTRTDPDHRATSFLPDQWVRTDEWYNYKDINPDIRVLLQLDESSYEGGTNGSNHPAAWYHEYDGGRAFYTAGGHTAESYQEELFLQHIWEGIKYAADGKDAS